MSDRTIQVPRYFKPWPHQAAAWQRRMSGKYRYYAKVWSRQAGKDQDDIQYGLNWAWNNPGTQQAYVGLDNVWVNNNIFKKYIDGRLNWDDYPEEFIDVNNTNKEVQFLNNPEGKSPARIKYIGLLNNQGVIGSSYNGFMFSEASLYDRNAFDYLIPIWDAHARLGDLGFVCWNGTPRGTRNVYYDLLKTYTGCEDPADFPGEHGDVYVDFVKIEDVKVPDGNGGYRRLYDDAYIEQLEDRYMRQFGNLNLFNQEFRCEFTTVNAGLVYRAVEQLVKEHRYTPINIDTHYPVYMAWDIGSKSKMSDASACIVFQYYNNHLVLLDWYETRGKALVECVSDLSQRPYFSYIRFAALPWDSERSASSETPAEECRRMFPNINWHCLEQDQVQRGIDLVRGFMPNMIINSSKCDWLLECFMNYEYKFLSKQDEWAAKPKHDKHSHLMDAVRYAAMAIKEIEYLGLSADGREVLGVEEYDYGQGFTQKAKPNTMYRVEEKHASTWSYI